MLVVPYEALPPDPFAGDPADPARALGGPDADAADDAPLDDAERDEVVADLGDLAVFEALLAPRGVYYFKNYVLFPALAGPFFGKVLLGNWLAETMRDVYSAATIYCGHVGDDVQDYEHGTKAKSRGEWYAMQIEASNDFEVSRPLSILCGGLDRQIEHVVPDATA